ncbi:hypothetical protein BJX99DRAFT_256065 [Aspergillus californicus]
MSTFKLTLDESVDDKRKVVGRYSAWKQFCVLQQYLEPGASGDLSVEDAARLLYQMLPRKREGLEQEHYFSGSLLKVAEQIPYSHPAQDKLVELVGILARTDRLNIRTDVNGYEYYSPMETMYQDIRGSTNSGWQTEKDQRDNANNIGFAARLMSAGLFVQLLFPFYHLINKLENNIAPKFASIGVLSTSIWILKAGHCIFGHLVLKPGPFSTDDQRCYAQGPLYNGPIKGIERWRYWQETLAARAGGVGISDEARELGKKAADLMAAMARDVTF